MQLLHGQFHPDFVRFLRLHLSTNISNLATIYSVHPSVTRAHAGRQFHLIYVYFLFSSSQSLLAVGIRLNLICGPACSTTLCRVQAKNRIFDTLRLTCESTGRWEICCSALARFGFVWQLDRSEKSLSLKPKKKAKSHFGTEWSDKEWEVVEAPTLFREQFKKRLSERSACWMVAYWENNSKHFFSTKSNKWNAFVTCCNNKISPTVGGWGRRADLPTLTIFTLTNRRYCTFLPISSSI